MHIELWQWPQWAYFILTLIGLLYLAHSHGKPKKGDNNFYTSILVTLPIWIILYYGGFFK